jgi:hypothetical protein
MREETRSATVAALLHATREVSLALGWSGEDPD